MTRKYRREMAETVRQVLAGGKSLTGAQDREIQRIVKIIRDGAPMPSPEAEAPR